MKVYGVLLDVSYDAWAAGLCRCLECLTAYEALYREGAEDVRQDLIEAGEMRPEDQIEVVTGAYDGPWPTELRELDTPPEAWDLWQQIHDARDWGSVMCGASSMVEEERNG